MIEKVRKSALVLVGVISLCTSSCFRKDEIITLPPTTGTSINDVASLGKLGDTTLFYNLKNNKIVKKSNTFSWDLCFESLNSTNAIFMNGGKGIRMYNTHETNFINVDYTSALAITTENWHVDKPSLLPTSSYIGEWMTNSTSKEEIYIVKMDNSNNNYIKIKFLSVDADKYVIQYGDIKATSDFITQTITKNKTTNYTYYSLTDNKIIDDFEPLYTSWDIVLTQYSFIYENLNNFTYDVKGVLLNPYKTTGYGDTTKEQDFAKVDLAYAQTLPLVNDRDVIGFLWKKLPNISGNYVVYDKFLYLVKTQNNELYKLHFISYYSNSGEAHSPKFEFERLQ